MKKAKFLPLIFVFPTLVGCGGPKSLSAPKFKKESNKVSYATFCNEYSKAFYKLVFTKEKNLESCIVVSDESNFEGLSIKRKDKEINSEKYLNIEKHKVEFNKEKKVIRDSETSTSKSLIGNSSGTDTYEENSKKTKYYQEKVNGKSSSIVCVTAESKTYCVEETLSDTFKVDDFDDSYMKSMAQDITGLMDTMLETYSASSAKKKFRFYKDGNMFTASLSKTKDEKLNYCNKRTTEEFKVQLELNGDKARGISWSQTTIDRKFTKEHAELKEYYYRYVPGDVEQYVIQSSWQHSFQSKKIGVKPVDLSNYRKTSY